MKTSDWMLQQLLQLILQSIPTANTHNACAYISNPSHKVALNHIAPIIFQKLTIQSAYAYLQMPSHIVEYFVHAGNRNEVSDTSAHSNKILQCFTCRVFKRQRVAWKMHLK